jgi:hypothetical protein
LDVERRFSQLVAHRQLLQDTAEPRLRLQFESLEVEFKRVLNAFRECLEGRLPALQGALAGLDRAVQDVRHPRPFAGEPPEAPSRLLDLVDRYRATAEAMEGCRRLLGSLHLQRYWGDYAL